MANNALKMAFILSATDKMSRVIDAAVKKSTDKLSAFERNAAKVGRGMMKGGAIIMGVGAAVEGAAFGATKATAAYGDTAWKTSQQVGIGVESWQRLAYAAKYYNVEQSALSASMVKLNKKMTEAVAGSKTAGQIFSDLGIKLKDASGKMRAPEAVFEDIAEKLSNVENGAPKTAAAVEIFGKSGASLIPLLNSGKEGIRTMGDEAEKMGFVLSEDVAKASERFNDDLSRVKDGAAGLAMQLGLALMPMLNDFSLKVQNVIGRITDWIRENPQLVTTIGKIVLWGGTLLLGLGALSFVFGTVLSVVGKVRKAFSGLMTAFSFGKKVVLDAKNSMLLFRLQYAGMVIWQKLAAAAQWLFNSALFACPIVWIIAAIAAVIAAVVLLVKHWDKISAFFKRLWDGIKKIFAAVWEWIKNMFLNYTPVGLVVKHWDKIKGWFSKLWEGVKNVFRSVWEWIKKMFLNYTPYGLVIKHWDKIKTWFSKLWEGVKSNFRNAWEWIKKMFLNYTPAGLVIKHWDKIKGWFSGLWDGVKGIFVGAWNGIKGVFSEMNPMEWIGNMWSGISEFFSALWQRFKQWGRQIIQGLIDGITGMAKKAIDGIKNIGRKIANGFKSFFGIHSPSKLFAEYGANITAGLTVGIDGGTGKVERSTTRMAEQANRGFSQNIETEEHSGGRIGQVNREIAAGNRAATASASQIANTIGGTSVTYAPQITVAAGVAGNIETDLRKLLKEHERDILEIVERAAANRTRLSFA
ncbi:MAG: phage tail tape measure protein [Rikenella sp.]|nr:phage tail tape measure protein [Rikenella sp.]